MDYCQQGTNLLQQSPADNKEVFSKRSHVAQPAAIPFSWHPRNPIDKRQQAISSDKGKSMDILQGHSKPGTLKIRRIVEEFELIFETVFESLYFLGEPFFNISSVYFFEAVY